MAETPCMDLGCAPNRTWKLLAQLARPLIHDPRPQVSKACDVKLEQIAPVKSLSILIAESIPIMHACGR